MLPILYRSILSEIIKLFFAIIIILLAIILSFRLSSLLSAAVSGDISLSAIWKLISLQIVNMLITLMPVALILASVMTLTRLYRDQEISAFFAAGLDRNHLHRIILILAIPLSILLLILTLQLLPEVSRQTLVIRSQARQQAGFALLTPNSFSRIDNNTVIHVGNQESGKYHDFFIAQNQPNKQIAIFASTGNIDERNNAQSLALSQGIRIAWQDLNHPETVSYTSYRTADLHLPQSDKDITLRARDLPTNQLTKSLEHQAELQNRLNPVIAMLIFCLCLPILAHVPPRKNNPQKLLPAFILFALYINLLDITVKAIIRGKIPLYPGSYAIHLSVFLLIIIWWFTTRKKLS